MRPGVQQLLVWLRTSWWQLLLVVVASLAYLTYRDKVRADAEEARAARLESATRRAADSVRQQREYVAKRRDACYDMYVRERQKWNNAEGPEYDADEDVCRVRYKDTGPNEDCSKFRPDSTTSPYMAKTLRTMFFDCITHTFTHVF